ncbi:MAG: serine hydrolase [Myxococcales bacterium]|nr:serine hydrolase [Myxococcales bacterium]
MNAHLEGPKGRSKLASAATFQRLQTPPKGGTYAAGWDVGTRPWAGGTTLSHSGSNTMNLVTTWIAPAKGLVMMVATNAATSGADVAVDAAFAPMVERFGN